MIRFMNTRATVKRLSDGKKLYGWVIESRKPGQIWIQITKGAIQAIQEPYELLLNSRLGAAAVPCILNDLVERCALFAIPHAIEITAPTAASRIAVPHYRLTILCGGKTIPATMLDIGNDGIGAISSVEIPSNTTVMIEIEADFGRKTIAAVSAYCSSAGAHASGEYRAGFKVDTSTRLSQANWKYIFNKVVEQAVLETQRKTRDRNAPSNGASAWRMSGA